MKVAFYQPHLCLRGTTVAMFDYALHNQSLLGNESIVVHHKQHQHNHPSSISRFQQHFKVTGIDGFTDLDGILQAEKVDAVYIIKGGYNDGRVSRVCRTLVHAVAMAPPSEAHGERFAYVSHWMTEHFGGSIPAVPYMVDVPDIQGDMRSELGIPADATVLGRTGGMDTWNIPWVSEAIPEVMAANPNLWLVLQNTPQFYRHKRIIHIGPSADMEYKVRFINTCDGMLHARDEGESFGCACGEFSVRNKPIITWSGSPQRNHIFILGKKGIYYSDKNEFIRVVSSFEKQPHLDWNCYRDYSPSQVMKTFNDIYLS